jgi:hypothetical protein
MSDYTYMERIVRARLLEMKRIVESKRSINELYEEYSKLMSREAFVDELGRKHCGEVY